MNTASCVSLRVLDLSKDGDGAQLDRRGSQYILNTGEMMIENGTEGWGRYHDVAARNNHLHLIVYTDSDSLSMNI